MPGMPNKLKASQKAMLKKHANHHSPEHMNIMRQKIAAGMSFDEAHKEAKKKVGS